MKETEEKLRAFFAQHRNDATTTPEQDTRILDTVLGNRDRYGPADSLHSKNNWSLLMRRKTSLISTSAVILLIAVGILFFDKGNSGGYAIAQTIQAIESIDNVYFKAMLFKQGLVECRMQFSPGERKPTHMRLYIEGGSISKIDSKDGSFTYNSKTGHYTRNSRNERNFSWYPDFRNLFLQALEGAQSSDSVKIYRGADPNTLVEMIMIDVSDPYRDFRLWIDPESLLPVRIETLQVKDPAYFMRQTIAVREMFDIQYNQILPEDSFRIPADAEEVFEEVDVFVEPDVGIPIGNMDESEACILILYRMVDALNNLDVDAFAKLVFPHGFLPRDMLNQMLQAYTKDNPDGPGIELLDYEPPYPNGSFWYVKYTADQPGRGIVEEVMPVRFYEFNGIRYCIIAYPD